MSDSNGATKVATVRTGKMPKQLRGEITRENILISAATAFDATGYAAASINDIIAASKSTKGALYFHFPAKFDIAQKLIDGWADAAASIEQKATDTDATPLEQLVMTCHAQADLVTTNVQHRAGMRLSAEPSLDGTAAYQQWEGRIGGLVDAGIAAAEVRDTPAVRRFAQLYCATLIGLVHTTSVHAEKVDIKTQIGDLLDGWFVGTLTHTRHRGQDRFLGPSLPVLPQPATL